MDNQRQDQNQEGIQKTCFDQKENTMTVKAYILTKMPKKELASLVKNLQDENLKLQEKIDKLEKNLTLTEGQKDVLEVKVTGRVGRPNNPKA